MDNAQFPPVQLTRSARHALALLAVLSQRQGSVVGTVLARDARVTVGATERLLRAMARAGFVRGQRGRAGGYVLSVSLHDIRMSALLDAVASRHDVGPDVPGLEGLQDIARAWLDAHSVGEMVERLPSVLPPPPPPRAPTANLYAT